MQYTKLGSSDLLVSRVCLGTMTWGIQNNQQEADEQIAFALDSGVNFWDTAELYPVPPNKQTYGDTERIIGNWLKRNTLHRKKIILASKVAGRGIPYIRDGGNITASAINTALDDSLARLNTDYLDLYQLHWPNRVAPHFCQHWPFSTDPNEVDLEQEIDGMRDNLSAIKQALDSGKIKYWGLSDDTPWGIHTYLRLCEEMGVDKPVSVQNEFSLLHAKDWPYLIESCIFENLAYLPWSPLGGGVLSGKYLNNQMPEGSRWTLSQRNGLFRDTENVHKATAAYGEIALSLGITTAQLSLAWINHIAGVTSTIIGATKMSQLKENIEAFDITLNSQALNDINSVFKAYPVPF